MKKVLMVLIMFLLINCTGCKLFEGIKSSDEYDNKNLSVGKPVEGMDVFVLEEDASYYKSNDVNLWLESNGLYTKYSFFTLDETNVNLRVYNNMYLHVGDYFYMISEDNKNWHADLIEGYDKKYAVKELEEGEDYSISIRSNGIYKIIFDLESKKFDVQYLDWIEEDKYLNIKNCEVCQFIDKKATYTKMEINPENEKELMLLNYSVNDDSTLYFFSISHTSNYKIKISEDAIDVIGKYANSNRQGITFLIEAKVNIYLNIETYMIRLEICK